MDGADPIKSSAAIATRRPIIKRAVAARAIFTIVSPLISGISTSPFLFFDFKQKRGQKDFEFS